MRPTPLRHPAAGRRSGITLTEILISILIMGVGMVSLATLFPLGLIRAQRAMRDSRSTLWAESAISEINTRNLFSYESFLRYGGCGWYSPPLRAQIIDTWATDTAAPAVVSMSGYQPGLPVCYDPLWWSIVDQADSTGNSNPATIGPPARFGNGTSFLRNSGDGCANGLQRITNFRRLVLPATSDFYEFVYHPDPNNPTNQVASEVFGSPDNVIFNGEDQEFPGQKPGDTSPLIPDLTLSGNSTVTRDLMFTWFFTGQRVTASELDQYVGSIVVCHNRVMGLETISFGNSSVTAPIGERTVEAIWGYSGTNAKAQIVINGNPATQYYGTGDRTVLLRWSTNMPDPRIQVDSFIADVTYNLDAFNSLTNTTAYPGRRCDWYRIIGYTPPADDLVVNGYRSTVVTLETPVKARTQVNAAGVPVFQNAALIMPSVVNVFPKTFVSRGAN